MGGGAVDVRVLGLRLESGGTEKQLLRNSYTLSSPQSTIAAMRKAT